MTDWHVIHLGNLALSGAALLTIEATAVVPEGRITYGDVGLYSDETELAMARVLETVRRWSDMPIAIQLAHAGRKASCEKPWGGGAQIPPGAPHGWPTVAPSPLSFAEATNGAHGPRSGRPAESAPSVRRCRPTSRPPRARRRSNSRSARVSAASVLVAAIEPAGRRVRRLAGQSHAVSARGVRRRTRGFSAAASGDHAGVRHGLGAGRLVPSSRPWPWPRRWRPAAAARFTSREAG